MNSFLKAQKIVKECKRLKLLIKATDTKRSIRFHSVIFYTIKNNIPLHLYILVEEKLFGKRIY